MIDKDHVCQMPFAVVFRHYFLSSDYFHFSLILIYFTLFFLSFHYFFISYSLLIPRRLFEECHIAHAFL